MPTFLTETIDRLAAFEPVPFPVLSLYLNTQADAVGRDRFDPFLRKAFTGPIGTYRSGSPERQSLVDDASRIARYLAESLRPSADGLAIFACSGANGFFEALQLEAPIDEHRLYVDDRPHLYPLARLDDRYPRYAAILADTSLARIFVFGANRLERCEEVIGARTKRVKAGGWSQARFQRHVDHYHLHHVKDIIARVERIVRDERIPRLLLAGDEVIVPLFREQLPPQLAERLVDVLRLDTQTPEREVLEATLAAVRANDANTDSALVARLFDEVRAGGLGVIGGERTAEALERGQGDLLLMTADAALLTNVGPLVEGRSDAVALPASDDRAARERAANRLVLLARQTGAGVRFIEDPRLLAEVGGVGALLRFRL